MGYGALTLRGQVIESLSWCLVTSDFPVRAVASVMGVPIAFGHMPTERSFYSIRPERLGVFARFYPTSCSGNDAVGVLRNALLVRRCEKRVPSRERQWRRSGGLERFESEFNGLCYLDEHDAQQPVCSPTRPLLCLAHTFPPSFVLPYLVLGGSTLLLTVPVFLSLSASRLPAFV